MKAAGCQVPDYMLQLPRINKFVVFAENHLFFNLFSRFLCIGRRKRNWLNPALKENGLVWSRLRKGAGN